MIRSFTADNIVTLPRLNGLSAARLLQELITAAKTEASGVGWLPSEIAELESAYLGIDTELTRRLTGEGRPAPVVRGADKAEDNAFIALYEWLHGWARLPVSRHPEAGDAAAVLAAVFPRGRTFLSLRPSDEWQEAELRLKLIADKGYDQIISELGGKALLSELRYVHKAYGEALGITSVKATVEPPAVGEAREAAVEALRGYVLRVSAQVRKSRPETRQLADRLLAPLIAWRDQPVGASEADATPAGNGPPARAESAG